MKTKLNLQNIFGSLNCNGIEFNLKWSIAVHATPYTLGCQTVRKSSVNIEIINTKYIFSISKQSPEKTVGTERVKGQTDFMGDI